jgi:CheY-like chemotaxis protein
MIAPAPAMHRLILRADVRWEGLAWVGHTVEVGPTRVVLRMARALPAGVTIELSLSFPRLVETVVLQGTIVATHDPRVHERTSAMTVDLQPSADRDRLAAILDGIPPPSDAAGSEPPPSGPSGYRVLLVDDNGLVREMFSYGVRKYFRLRQGSVTVDVAENGVEAWRMLREAPYDLAIVDFYMPAMNGSDLISRMRKTAELADVPVVVISVGGREAQEASVAAGADLFLDKPVALRDLFATLEKLTARELQP